jgi:hypothetical protein
VPWCDDCARFWTPPSMKADGTCPSCGRPLTVERVTARNLDLKKLAGEDARVPWHFKVLVLALALYLGWRLVQLLGWIF